MRAFVQSFLGAAAGTLELAGPVVLLASHRGGREAARWMRRQFAGQVALDCRVTTAPHGESEIDLGMLPVEHESLQSLLCLDVLRRFEETEDLLRRSLSLLAPGGMLLLTADTRGAHPQEGLSRVLTPVGLERLVAELDAAILGWQGDPDFPESLFLVACRSPVPDGFATRAGRFIEAFQASERAVPPSPSWSERFRRLLRQLRLMPSPPELAESAPPASFLLHLPRAANWKQALFGWPPVKDATARGVDLC
ncbi:MAG: hypothetical protein ABUL64_04300 [Singulisphaera sp.]